MSGWHVTSNDIVKWTQTAKREAEAELPTLVRDLIKASTIIKEMSFPIGDDISLPGLDGLVYVEESKTRFAPSGISIWEIGTNADTRKKAEDDYIKRTTQDVLGINRAETTFIFVTSRKWTTKQKWIAEKTAENKWAQVHVIDAVDLAEWLEDCVAVHRWFARKLGKLASCDAAWDWEYAWESWSKVTTPFYSAALAIAGRDEQLHELQSKIKDRPSVIRIRAFSNEDAYGFVLAAFATLSEFLPRIVIIRTEESWHSLISHKKTGPLILINCSNKELNHGYAIDQGHHIIVFGGTSHIVSGELDLPIPNKSAQIDSLVKMGLEIQNAENIVRSSRGRTTLIRRHRDMHPQELKMPEWVTAEYANIIIPAIFAEAWHSTNYHDCQMVANLANMDYEIFEEKLVQIAKDVDDPPVRLIGKAWTILSRQDAFIHLRSFVSAGFIKRLCAVAVQVLQENDPRFDEPPNERWMSFERTKYSGVFSEGVASALAMVAHEFDEEFFISTIPIKKYISKSIADIFGNDLDARRWYSLRKCLRSLAEASPHDFLIRLEEDLKKDKPEILGLFIEEGTYGSFPHANLLWALEIISWNTKYFTRTIQILVLLCRIKLDDRVGNNPFRSLRYIFKPWNPRTIQSPSERMHTLELIYPLEPTVIWDLLLDMLPRTHDHSSPIQQPQYADWSKDWQRRTTHEEITQSINLVQDSILSKIHKVSYIQLSMLLRAFQKFDKGFANKLLDCLHSIQWDQIPSDGIRQLTNVLHEMIAHHRQFSEEKWSFPEWYIRKLEEIKLRLTKGNIVARHNYLFNWGDIGVSKVDDFEEENRIATRIRIEALEDIWKCGGQEGIIQLIHCSQAYTILADCLVQCSFSNSIDEFMLEWLYDNDITYKRIAFDYFFRRSSNNPQKINEMVEAIISYWSADKQAIFYSALPFNKVINLLEQLTPETYEEYWKVMEPCGVDFQNAEQIRILLSKLLQFNRSTVAAHIAKLAIYPNKDNLFIEDQLIVDILKAMARDDNPNFDAAISLLKYLQKKNSLPQDIMTALEWNYLPVLNRRDIRPITLITNIIENPLVYVDMLRISYLPSAKIEEPDIDMPNQQLLIERAHALLESLDRLPGQNGNSIDENKLTEWIEEVRQKSSAAYRAQIADYCIGELLAKAPKGEDGIWPHETVRDVLEYYQNTDIERGVLTAQYNQRGVTSRGIFDGGAQEKVLAQAFKKDADTIKKKWPRASRLLMIISERYLDDAKDQDQRAELTELECY